jgi:hypothetical protein
MSSCAPFHYTYKPDVGMTASLGDLEYAKLLEAMASGLPTDAAWAGGGPLIWQPPGVRRKLVGWLRGIGSEEFGRAGAWEAWGVLVPEDFDISYWPWFWNRFAAGPSSNLRQLAKDFEFGKREFPPPITIEFSAILADLYAAHQRGETLPYNVPLSAPDDVGLLAWAWLLGPADPSKAFVGPPRRGVAAVSPPLSYSGLIDGPLPGADQPELRAIVGRLIDDGVYGGTLAKKVVSLRERVKGAAMHTSSDAASRDETEPQTIFGLSIPSLHRSNVWNGLITLLLLFAILLLLGIRRDGSDVKSVTAQLRQKMEKIVPTDTAGNSGETGTLTAASTTTTATDETATVRFTPKPVNPALAMKVREYATGHPPFRFTPDFVKLAARSNERNAKDMHALRVAALQMYFFDKGWYQGDVDGQLGPGFLQAMRNSGGDPDLARAVSDDDFVLTWLQSH